MAVAEEAPAFHSHDALIAYCVERLHSDHARAAASAIAKFSGTEVATFSDAAVQKINFSLLQWCLDNSRYVDAAALCWPGSLFSPHPQSTRDVWKIFEESNQFMLMGSASMSKSFSMGVRLMLEWIRDPEYTSVKVLGPSENHLQDNLFSHLVELHQNSAIKLPGVIGSLFIGLSTRSRRGAIVGVVVPTGKKPAAKIQGTKRFPRPKPHPEFGALSRLLIFMDEVNEIPVGIWRDVDNVLATVTEGGGMKIGGAFNPRDQRDEVGIRVEPEWGWESFDMDQHFRWKSKRGWDVLRLDALQCENIVEKKTVYAGLQTIEGMENIIRNSGGTDSPGYYAMVRAAYPPMGVSFSVIPQSHTRTLRAQVLWATTPKPVAGADLALEGGDKPILAKGDFGKARGFKFPPSLEYPSGQEVLFKTPEGKPVFRRCLQLTEMFELPGMDTVALATKLRDLCKSLAVRPEDFCVDRTGNGAGVHDTLKHIWSDLVRGVNYYQGATKLKILEEDEKSPEETCDRMISELWLGLQKWVEFEYFKIHPSVPTDKLFGQFTNRKWRPGRLAQVEKKKDYRSRGFPSPDDADAVTLMLFAARHGTDPISVVNPGSGSALPETGEPFFFVGETDLYDADL